MCDALGWCSRRHRFRHLLLKEALSSHPVRAPLKCQQAICHVWRQLWKDPCVVLSQVLLRIAFIGPEHLLRMRYLDGLGGAGGCGEFGSHHDVAGFVYPEITNSSS